MQNAFLKLFILLIVVLPSNIETEKPAIVLELFTSQGCSSCPRADKLVEEMETNFEKANIISLSYHVDYWNYIGWKDPFSKTEYTKKQKTYSRKFYSSTNYTPQVVINGKEHFVGSDRTVMNTKLETYSKTPSSNTIDLSTVKKQKHTVSFNYNVEGDIDNKNLRVVLVINSRETFVKRGENTNRTLKNTNVVVAEQLIKLNVKSGNNTITIPEIVEDTDSLSLILISQTDNLDITGAVKSGL